MYVIIPRRDKTFIWVIICLFAFGISLCIYVVYRQSSFKVYNKKQTIAIPQQDPETWTPPSVPEHLQTVDQDDEELIQHIRDHWVIPPYPVGQWKLYNRNKVHYSQMGQSEAVDLSLDAMEDGFFFECGAGNGQFLSNSLFFEKYRNWTGLLVEVNPATFSQLVKVRRHAYMLNACLSPSRHPMVLNYTTAKLMGGLDSFMEASHKQVIRKLDIVSGSRIVQCFPLVSILKAIGVSHVDYFSLDVEGPELEILQTVPFDVIDVTTLTVEYLVQNDAKRTKEKHEAIERLMVDKYGYKEMSIIQNLDILFKKVRT